MGKPTERPVRNDRKQTVNRLDTGGDTLQGIRNYAPCTPSQGTHGERFTRAGVPTAPPSIKDSIP